MGKGREGTRLNWRAHGLSPAAAELISRAAGARWLTTGRLDSSLLLRSGLQQPLQASEGAGKSDDALEACQALWSQLPTDPEAAQAAVDACLRDHHSQKQVRLVGAERVCCGGVLGLLSTWPSLV